MFSRKFIAFLILIYINSGTGEECISFDFESDYQSLFNYNVGACANILQPWEERQYALSPIESPHNLSETYISPLSTTSCVTSFPFIMSASGAVEVFVYMDGGSITDSITVIAYQVVSGGNDVVLGSSLLTVPEDGSFVSGWQTLEITLIGSGTFQGYVLFMGSASTSSLLIVDSFRYIPPSVDQVDCQVYHEENVPNPEPEVSVTSKPDASTDVEPEPDVDPEPEVDPTPDPGVETEPEVDTNPDTDVDPLPDVDPEPEEDASPEIYPDSDNTECEHSFWNPITIAMVVILCLLLIIVTTFIAYYIGFRKAQKLQDVDIENLPSVITVPRVKAAYIDINYNPYTRGPQF